MAARPGQTNEISAPEDKTVSTGSADAAAQPLQGESPYQSTNGLAEMRTLADKTAQAGGTSGIPEVSWAKTVEKAQDGGLERQAQAQAGSPKEAIGNQVTSMIFPNGDRTLESLRQTNPKLAGEIDKAVKVLEGKSPEVQAETLRVMGELYRGMDPRPTDNRESKAHLLQVRRDPAYVPGILNKANELVKMKPKERMNETLKLKIEIRTMHLDGGNL
ncbi:MAG: hypothetical protein SGJ27_29615 [Candidatus Melainabacteria bacterium]|nr:hypothetical protein [Candidatus Melainabacteria bacterium]